MGNQVRKIADIQESAWTQASGKIAAGLGIFLVAACLIYAARFAFVGLPRVLEIVQIVLGLVALAGVGLLGAAVYTGIEARRLPGIGFQCPYCDNSNKFDGIPTETFDCDFCNRTVHFDGGVPVPVRIVSCPFCQTDHRVAVSIQRYVCDHCNRPLELAAQPRSRPSGAAGSGPEKLAQNFDVLLVSVDRRHEIEIALKIQNLMVVNLPDARRLMATASTTSPLVVTHSVPQRKAETIRRQLQDVGATATLRPSNETTPTSPRLN